MSQLRRIIQSNQVYVNDENNYKMRRVDRIYSNRRRTMRIQWLKMLRKLRKSCLGNQKCIFFLKNNQPKSVKSYNRLKKIIKKFNKFRLRQIKKNRRIRKKKIQQKRAMRKMNKSWSNRKKNKKHDNDEDLPMLYANLDKDGNLAGFSDKKNKEESSHR